MKKREVEISARMKALADMVTPGLTGCDIGCDHGFVSIYLVQKGICEKVLAMDVRKGPLSQAAAHILEYGLEGQIQTRLSDGLQQLHVGEAECMICAGMGGPLMTRILEEGRDKALAMKELILQPQSEIREFRAYLRTHGYRIVQEDMVYEDGKFYPMMKAVPTEGYFPEEECREEGNPPEEGRCIEGAAQDPVQQLYDAFGPCLLRERHPVLKRYLEHSERVVGELAEKLKAQQGEKALARLPQLEEELQEIRRGLTYFQMPAEQ